MVGIIESSREDVRDRFITCNSNTVIIFILINYNITNNDHLLDQTLLLVYIYIEL